MRCDDVEQLNKNTNYKFFAENRKKNPSNSFVIKILNKVFHLIFAEFPVEKNQHPDMIKKL